MESIHLFSPATVANVACGYDILGFCLDSVGDYMTIKKTSSRGIKITKIEGCELPLNTQQNVAGVSAQALYDDLKPSFGFEIEINKKIKPGSGIGSSAASAAGSVFGINVLLGNPLTQMELISYAMKGEALASQAEHADNVAPAILGGFTLVQSLSPLLVHKLPVPESLYAVILHPHIEVKTSTSRSLLPTTVSLKKMTLQCANMGSLVHALHTSDYDLIKLSLVDYIAEPYRKQLIPHFEEVKEVMQKSPSLGSSIAGSGPSIFALCKGETDANMCGDLLRNTYQKTSYAFDVYVSKINTDGIKIIK